VVFCLNVLQIHCWNERNVQWSHPDASSLQCDCSLRGSRGLGRKKKKRRRNLVLFSKGGKRKGAFAIYLEPWHADIFEVLELKKNTGPEELRARDLFYGLWIPDLFMKRVEENGQWSLMCPDECPGLFDSYGGDCVSFCFVCFEKPMHR
jgi:hypothetical protein